MNMNLCLNGPPMFMTKKVSAGLAAWRFARSYDFIVERRYLATLSEKNRDFRFHAKQKCKFPAHLGSGDRRIIALRPLEYQRLSTRTNPYLSQETRLVGFSDMISQWPQTACRFPITTPENQHNKV